MPQKIVRFSLNNETKIGKIDQGKVVCDGFEKNLDEVNILPPVDPGKIICVGLNYKKHAKELGHDLSNSPVFFYKPPSSVIGYRDKIILPENSNRVDYEGEMAVLIGKKCKNIEKEEVNNHILGYTCLNDVTARDIQNREKQWVVSKGFDTFCPIGPFISRNISDKAKIQCLVNGEIKQSSSLENLIFDEKDLITSLSKSMTLNRGDIVSTGTPKGVGPLKDGDEVKVRVDGIGALKNEVKDNG